MCKIMLIGVLAIFLVGADAASKPDLFDGKVFALSLGGVYPNEDELVGEACDDRNESYYKLSACQAAICNEWNGPFLLRDFALWLRSTHLDKRLRLEKAQWDSDPSFKHLPANMQKFGLETKAEKTRSVVVFVVDEGLTADQVESVLEDPSKTAAGQGPIVYGITPVSFPF